MSKKFIQCFHITLLIDKPNKPRPKHKLLGTVLVHSGEFRILKGDGLGSLEPNSQRHPQSSPLAVVDSKPHKMGSLSESLKADYLTANAASNIAYI